MLSDVPHGLTQINVLSRWDWVRRPQRRVCCAASLAIGINPERSSVFSGPPSALKLKSHGLHANGLRRIESTGLFGLKLHESRVKPCPIPEIYMRQSSFWGARVGQPYPECVTWDSKSCSVCLRFCLERATLVYDRFHSTYQFTQNLAGVRFNVFGLTSPRFSHIPGKKFCWL